MKAELRRVRSERDAHMTQLNEALDKLTSAKSSEGIKRAGAKVRDSLLSAKVKTEPGLRPVPVKSEPGLQSSSAVGGMLGGPGFTHGEVIDVQSDSEPGESDSESPRDVPSTPQPSEQWRELLRSPVGRFHGMRYLCDGSVGTMFLTQAGPQNEGDDGSYTMRLDGASSEANGLSVEHARTYVNAYNASFPETAQAQRAHAAMLTHLASSGDASDVSEEERSEQHRGDWDGTWYGEEEQEEEEEEEEEGPDGFD